MGQERLKFRGSKTNFWGWGCSSADPQKDTSQVGGAQLMRFQHRSGGGRTARSSSATPWVKVQSRLQETLPLVRKSPFSLTHRLSAAPKSQLHFSTEKMILQFISERNQVRNRRQNTNAGKIKYQIHFECVAIKMKSCVSVEETRPQQNAGQKLCLLIIDKDDIADLQGRDVLFSGRKPTANAKFQVFVSYLMSA